MTGEMEPDIDQDRSLVTAFIRRRDESAFRQLYRRHTPSLYLLARRLLGGAHSAEDAIQDTWLRASGRLDSFRWESSLRTWLCGIAVNRCREMLKGAEGSRGTNPFDSVQEPVYSARTFPAPEERIDLEHAISLLPAGSRGVLVLHDIEGRTHVEIAVMLEIDEGTSRSQLFKARHALREILSARRVPPDEKGVRHEP
jgi:RNA polymerase sigma-70 factor (ECF subfamily)